MSEEVTYSSYLNLDRILDAQDVRAPDGSPRPLGHHDELLFIVIHQVYELWFKQVVHELERVRNVLTQETVPEKQIPTAVKSLRRVHEIQKIMVDQLGVLETMNPLDFLAFRDQLGNASGFQSAQFRELELLAGLDDAVRYEYEGKSFERRFEDDVVARFNRRREEHSLKQALYQWLARTPIEPAFRDTFLTAFDGYVQRQVALHEANGQLTAEERARVVGRLDEYRENCHAFFSGEDGDVRTACLFIAAYREEPLLHWPNRVLDSLVEFEELWRLWRFRHARMVERMIGLRVGTGGSSGVGYLDKTAGDRYRIFTVILQTRTFLIPRALLPDLQDGRRYGFAQDLR